MPGLPRETFGKLSLFLFFKIEMQLIYNITLVSDVHLHSGSFLMSQGVLLT